jgi:hypothetical protein
MRQDKAWALEQGLARLELEVLAKKPAAVHLYQSEGFVLEGLKRAAVIKPSAEVDLLIMAWIVWTRRRAWRAGGRIIVHWISMPKRPKRGSQLPRMSADATIW